VAKVQTEMRTTAQAFIDLTLELFDIVINEYDAPWAARRDRATSVRDREKPRP
jgi:hypothetical protein